MKNGWYSYREKKENATNLQMQTEVNGRMPSFFACRQERNGVCRIQKEMGRVKRLPYQCPLLKLSPFTLPLLLVVHALVLKSQMTHALAHTLDPHPHTHTLTHSLSLTHKAMSCTTASRESAARTSPGRPVTATVSVGACLCAPPACPSCSQAPLPSPSDFV
mmetsp:Transcript_47982/g.94717  ORF Transcript_47982/g.94717 Transcript_47982/m.94717 type:complete len:162 (-) Transcript_47982:583-1068(-)